MVTTVKTEKRICENCTEIFWAFIGEVNRGGAKVCSRKCYYEYQRATRPRDEKSWAWKGDKVGREALHNWVQRHRGKPKLCEHCGTTKSKKYEWANKTGEYKRELSDWLRLCSKCHAKYDYAVRSVKWAVAVKRLGWNVTKIKT